MPDSDSIWTLIGTAIGFGLFGLISIALTLIGLPGIWLMIVVVLGLKWWNPEWISWWVIAVSLFLAFVAELIEFVAGAAGSSRGGGTKSAAVGAIIGGIVGAIAGAAFPPFIGAIIWGTVGAGLGAAIGEITSGKEWRKTLPVGTAAAAGKLVGTLTKTAIAVIIYAILLATLIIN